MIPAAFLTITDRMSEAMFLIERDGRIVAANRAAAELLGARAGDLPGRRLSDFTDDPDRLARHAQLWWRSGDPLAGGLRVRAADGEFLDCRVDGHSVIDAQGGRVVLVRCRPKSQEATSRRFMLLNEKIEQLAREILQGKRIEEERSALLEREQAARIAAEDASRLKDEFLAVLSHELRTPLTSAYGWVRFIRTQPHDTAKLQHATEVIERSIDLQLRLVNDLLDVSALEMGKLAPELRVIDLATVLHHNLETVKELAASQGIALAQRIESPLPILGDEMRMHQVVANLLSNAVKFTPPGGRIEMTADRVDERVRLVVRDTGRGIRPEFLPHVFDKFRQAEGSTTRRVGGVGIGLTLVRAIVQLHGGQVAAESAGDNQGATFTVTLPGVASDGTEETDGSSRDACAGRRGP